LRQLLFLLRILTGPTPNIFPPPGRRARLIHLRRVRAQHARRNEREQIIICPQVSQRRVDFFPSRLFLSFLL
tara:strand:+ start:1569 stop:1784 length:216 start_codon:yes stop_codon:yes gene_type:complete